MTDVVSFSSLTFLFRFLPLFLLVYYLVPAKGRNTVALLGSLLFYAFGDLCFLPLLLALIGVNYVLANRMSRVPRANYSIYRERSRKRYTIAAVIIDTVVLALFKIFSFFGLVAMPLGLSFFLFKMLSFQVDLYRDDIYEQPTLWSTALYFSLFPQISQGPIMRYDDGHFGQEKKRGIIAIEEGLTYFIPGLALKVLLADRIGILWNDLKMYGYDGISTGLAYLGAFAYSFELYFDFFGYSLMASGLMVMLGYEFTVNFDSPYAATSISEFYRRWHITLGSFFRDYVYIPLGGSRNGTAKTVRNLALVWLLTGLWHGNGWNFLIWGLVLGVLVILEKLLYGNALKRYPLLGHLYVLFLIPLSWVIFAVGDLREVLIYFGRLFPFGESASYVDPLDILSYLQDYWALFLAAIVLCAPAVWRFYETHKKKAGMLFVLFALFWISVYFSASGANNPFMYLRF